MHGAAYNHLQGSLGFGYHKKTAGALIKAVDDPRADDTC
jgi:hypothetical protein